MQEQHVAYYRCWKCLMCLWAHRDSYIILWASRFCILQVILYDGQTKEVARTISRFKDSAFSGCYRSDGKLLVAGSQDGIVQVGAVKSLRAMS
jgi:hypothetical protein